MDRKYSAIVVVALLTALAVAGCGGGSESTSNEATLGTTRNDELGTILVDSEGFTVYDFHKDKGGKSFCYGTCAEAWPPVTTKGMPEAADGAMAAKLGTTMRKDGTTQVTYAGWPLYTYVADKKPGEANGNDIDAFGAPWYALKPSGEEPEENEGS